MANFLPYGRQSISEDDIQAVVHTLRGEYLTQGPAVEEFEHSLADYIGCKHVVVVNSGTAALHLAYLAMNLKAGDAVIIPAITFAATANAAVYCGATPVFADVDPQTGLMTAETCRAGIERALNLKLKPRLVVPVHYAGLPVQLAEISKVAKEFDCQVFEDACHALGAEYRPALGAAWRKVGNWGDGSNGAAFSFHPVKHIATGEGGALTTNDEAIAAKARILRSHGITKESKQFREEKMAIDSTTGKFNPWYYEMQELGWNYRMCDVLASLGNSQLKRIESNVARRKEIASWYQDAISQSTSVKQPTDHTGTARHSWHLYPIQIDFVGQKKSRAELMNTLREDGIGTQVHYIPVPELPFYRKNFPQDSSDWINSRQFYQRELSLPMFPEVTKAEVNSVIEKILTFFSN